MLWGAIGILIAFLVTFRVSSALAIRYLQWQRR